MQKLSGIYSLMTKNTAYHIEVGTGKPAQPEIFSKTTADLTDDKKSLLLGSNIESSKRLKKDRSQSDNETRTDDRAMESARFLEIADALDEEDLIEKEIIKEDIA